MFRQTHIYQALHLAPGFHKALYCERFGIRISGIHITMIDPAIVPQRTLYTGAKMPVVGMGTFGSDHADADAVSASVAGALRVGYRSFDCA